MVLLDTRTLDSLYDLASVVRDYTSPGRRSRTELTRDQKIDGCTMRRLHGWHVHHIVEALGITNANYSHNWEDNMLEALEECAQSDYWNSQQIRLAPGQQISKEGTNPYGAARTSALRNAIAQVLIADPRTRTAPEQDEEGKDVPGTGLTNKAFVTIDRQIEEGSYRNERPPLPGRQILNRIIRDLQAQGFLWEGAGRTERIEGLTPEAKEAVDNEIRRLCRLQLAEGATIMRGGEERPVTINYSAIARDVYKKFIIDEDLQETMALKELPQLLPGYARQVCIDAQITALIRRPLADQVTDEANIKLVKDERTKDPTSSDGQIHQRTGLPYPVVRGVLAAQGLSRTGRAHSQAEIRKIILAAHDDQLTIEEMIEKHPELVTHFKDNVNPTAEVIRGILRGAGKTPHTSVTLAAEVTEKRRIGLRASQLKSVFLAYIRAFSDDEADLQRLQGNLDRGRLGYSQSTLHTVDSLAEKLEETPEFTRKVLAQLEAETPQLVAVTTDGSIVIPRSALEWIARRGGRPVAGEKEEEGIA